MAEQIECNWCQQVFDVSEIGANVLWHSTASTIFRGEAGRVHQISARQYKGASNGTAEQTRPFDRTESGEVQPADIR